MRVRATEGAKTKMEKCVYGEGEKPSGGLRCSSVGFIYDIS